jgi:hypothetical protein
MLGFASCRESVDTTTARPWYSLHFLSRIIGYWPGLGKYFFLPAFAFVKNHNVVAWDTTLLYSLADDTVVSEEYTASVFRIDIIA